MGLNVQELTPQDILLEREPHTGQIRVTGVDVGQLRGADETWKDVGIHRRADSAHRSGFGPIFPPHGDRALGSTANAIDPDPNLAATPHAVQLLKLALNERLEGVSLGDAPVNVTLPKVVADLLFVTQNAVVQEIGGYILLTTTPALDVDAGKKSEVAFADGRYLCRRSNEHAERADARAEELFHALFLAGSEGAVLEKLMAAPEARYSLDPHEVRDYGLAGDEFYIPAKLDPDIKVELEMPLPKGFRLHSSADDDAAHTENRAFLSALEYRIIKLALETPQFSNIALEKGNGAWRGMIKAEHYPGALKSFHGLVAPDGLRIADRFSVVTDKARQPEHYILSVEHVSIDREEGDYYYSTMHTFGVAGLQERPETEKWRVFARVKGKQAEGKVVLRISMGTALKLEHVGSKELGPYLTLAASERKATEARFRRPELDLLDAHIRFPAPGDQGEGSGEGQT